MAVHNFYNLKKSSGERIWLSFYLNDVCRKFRIFTGLRIEQLDFKDLEYTVLDQIILCPSL